MGDLFALFWNMAAVFLLERNIPKRDSSTRNRNILAISQSVVLRQEIEKHQNRAARFITSNYCFETGSMTGILEKKVKWASLKKRRRDSRMILLYKVLKGAASIPTDHLIPQLGAVEIITHRFFKSPLQELTFTKAHSSLKQSEIGMPFQFRSLPLLRE